MDSSFVISKPIEEVINILSFKAAHKMIRIETDYQDIEPDERLRCDERRLVQVMLNLVSNALKFTPTNGLITINARLIKASN